MHLKECQILLANRHIIPALEINKEKLELLQKTQALTWERKVIIRKRQTMLQSVLHNLKKEKLA